MSKTKILFALTWSQFSIERFFTLIFCFACIGFDATSAPDAPSVRYYLDTAFSLDNIVLQMHQHSQKSTEYTSVNSSKNPVSYRFSTGIFIADKVQIGLGYMLPQSHQFKTESYSDMKLDIESLYLNMNVRFMHTGEKLDEGVFAVFGTHVGYQKSKLFYKKNKANLSGFFLEASAGTEAHYWAAYMRVVLFTVLQSYKKGSGTAIKLDGTEHRVSLDNSWGVRLSLGYVF